MLAEPAPAGQQRAARDVSPQEADERRPISAAVDCYIALGSNLGDRARHIAAAWRALSTHPNIETVSTASLYQTAPVGGPPEQDPYLNTVICVRTSLPPEALLRLCLDIEDRLGRKRLEPDGPRTIDIDMLLFGDRVCHTAALILPHPRMHLRRFVLAPLAEIAPGVLHPTVRRRIDELLADLEPAEVTGQCCVRVADAGWQLGC